MSKSSLDGRNFVHKLRHVDRSGAGREINPRKFNQSHLTRSERSAIDRGALFKYAEPKSVV